MEKPQYSLPAKKNPAQLENFQHTQFLIKRIDNLIIWVWYGIFLIATYIIIFMVLTKEKINHYSCNFIWVINIQK